MTLTVTSLVMGAFGAFLRWLQNRTAFETDTGLPVSGATASVIFGIYCVLMVCGMLGVVLLHRRRMAAPAEAEDAFRVEGIVSVVVGWALCAAFSVAGLRLMFTAGDGDFPLLQRLFGAFSILAGVCLPVLPARRVYEDVSLLGRRAAAVLLCLFYSYWLVFCYLSNIQRPVLWSYAPEILAVAAATMAAYYVAGWFYGRVKPWAAVFCLQLSVFFSLCALPDASGTALTVLMAASAGFLTMVEYIISSNLRDAPGK